MRRRLGRQVDGRLHAGRLLQRGLARPGSASDRGAPGGRATTGLAGAGAASGSTTGAGTAAGTGVATVSTGAWRRISTATAAAVTKAPLQNQRRALPTGARCATRRQ